MNTKWLKSKMGPGEPFVWMSGMGLAVGLLMVIGLIGLIFYRGTVSFWPQRVVSVDIAGEQLFGEIVIKRQRHGHEGQNEWQLFMGNRDVWGESFRYINEEEIKTNSYPQDIIMVERFEYGDAIGIVQKLILKEGQEILAGPALDDKLDSLLAASLERWDQIKDIEKYQIGSVSRELEALKFEEKEALAQASFSSEQKAEFDRKRQQLEEQHEVLMTLASSLRTQQSGGQLVLKLADGRLQAMDIGGLLHFYYPNRLSLGDRLVLFVRNIWVYLTTDPREANTEGGVFPALFGTFVMTLLMTILVTPFGVLGAIYLREYAKQGPIVRMVRIAVNNLAGVPSIVFGVFGLGFFVYLFGASIDEIFFSHRLPTPTFGTGGLIWASLTLALMTVPVVIVATEEALAAVPQGMREAGLACGASKWQTIYRIVLPAAAPGVLTGMILAMARGAGEVAPLMLVGVVKLAPTLPLNSIFPYLHLDQKFMHLGFHIYDLGFQSPDSEAALPMVFATTLLLIVLVIVLNLGAIFIRERLRRKYATSAF